MTDNPLKVIQPWYKEGLHFQCTECGKCCTGTPGYTWLSEEEIKAIAKHLNLSLEEFVPKYLRKVGSRWALLEHPETYACIFLKDKKCQIYPIRPTQCKTYPWWLSQLTSREAWEAAAKDCEGINQGSLVPQEEIEEKLHKQMEYERQL